VRWRPAGVLGGSARQLADQQTVQTPSPHPNHRAVAPLARVTTLVAVALALFLGVTMVAGDAYMFYGTNSGPGRPFNLAAAKDANRLLPYWPDSALELAQIKAFDSLSGVSVAPADLVAARRWTAVAASRDPRNPQLWTLLASADVEVKEYGLARTEYYRALSCDKSIGWLSRPQCATRPCQRRCERRSTVRRRTQARPAADARSRDQRSCGHAECQNALKFPRLPSILTLVAVSIDPRRKVS
jgi:hypothetical protein